MVIARKKHLNPFDTLGLPYGASRDEIRRAFRRRAKRYHPDVNRDDTEAVERFREIQQAFEILVGEESCRDHNILNPMQGEMAGYGQCAKFDHPGMDFMRAMKTYYAKMTENDKE